MDLRSALRRLNDPASDPETLRLLQAADDGEIARCLSDVFADGDAGLLAGLAGLLAGKTDARVVRNLLPLLRDENPRVRNAARAILERVAGEAPEPVLEFSRDPDSRMRIFATSILACLTPAVAAPRLIEMLGDADPTVVDCAVAALGTLRAEEAVDRLAEFLLRSRSWIRLSALDALTRIGTPAAVRAILSALPGADEETGAIFASVLARLQADAAPELAVEIRAVLEKAGHGSSAP